jgi:hypothetical protein
MAKFSAKMMGKEVGDAGVYAEPHTMKAKATNVNTYSEPMSGAKVIDQMNISAGTVGRGNYKPINPYGVGKMRGYGAATKGRKISGKMG